VLTSLFIFFNYDLHTLPLNVPPGLLALILCRCCAFLGLLLQLAGRVLVGAAQYCAVASSAILHVGGWDLKALWGVLKSFLDPGRDLLCEPHFHLCQSLVEKLFFHFCLVEQPFQFG
jgi:hypothetical protein